MNFYLIGSILFLVGSLILTFEYYINRDKYSIYILISYIFFDLGCIFFIIDSLKLIISK
jgi:hypothetical protein